ncbi:MAG: hypothetical protein AAGG48_25045 [Planctomycetota bacterium]
MSAALCRIAPGETEATSLGDTLSYLKYVVDDPEVEQAKIHSKPVQSDDGYIYFTSMDERGEKPDGSTLPIWGSHLWRLDPMAEEVYWEHVRAFPDALIATNCTGKFVYALGYFGHVLYQYDTETGSIRSNTVGSVGGHISRNFLVDLNQNAYVPRITPTGSSFKVELVQLDPELNELGVFPLTDYDVTADFRSHGIVSYAALKNGDLVFVTAKGALYRVVTASGQPSSLERLGWIHPEGESYSAFLVCPDGEQVLCSLSRAKQAKQFQWLTYDLQENSQTATDLDLPPDSPLLDALAYGCNTIDDDGNAFIVGQHNWDPFVLRVSWSQE